VGRRKRTSGDRDRRRHEKSSQEALLRALNHPVRAKALTVLAEKIASPGEISERIEIPLSNVSYHMRVLSELGLVEMVEEEPARGSIVHFYRAVERPQAS
jgi:DNA-binding transcriptional ArsR family regulator